MAAPRRHITFVFALCLVVLIVIMGIRADTSQKNHLDIKIRFSHYDAKAQPVCLVTFSNASGALIVCASYFEIDFMTNGIWTSTSYSEPGGVAGPFLPYQLSQKTIVLPTNTTLLRVKQTYECLPVWVESIASKVGGRKSWKGAYTLFKKSTKTDDSDVYVIPSPPSLLPVLSPVGPKP